MRSIPAKHIDGDVAVGRNVSSGGNANIQGRVRIGHDLVVEGWLEARNVKSVNKGLFSTAQALQEAYPDPEIGWFAGVLATDEDMAELGLTAESGKLFFRMYLGHEGIWNVTDGLYEIEVDLTFHGERIEEIESSMLGLAAELAVTKESLSDAVFSIALAEQNIDLVELMAIDAQKSADDARKVADAAKRVTDTAGQPGGLAVLGEDGLIPESNLPSFIKVASEDAMEELIAADAVKSGRVYYTEEE